ncbi:YlxR family protein, partial [Klebsiella pneumoniae]|nr:YlxR family protein [Klebsiella pneumoniae]
MPEPVDNTPSPSPSRKREGSERKCILSGETAARDALIRLAISPDGLVLPDVLARAPGRGAWIGVSREALEKALAKGKLKGALARS